MTNAVTVSFPAQTQYVSLARTMAAAMAVRADLPIDQLEDLRLQLDGGALGLLPVVEEVAGFLRDGALAAGGAGGKKSCGFGHGVESTQSFGSK